MVYFTISGMLAHLSEFFISAKRHTVGTAQELHECHIPLSWSQSFHKEPSHTLMSGDRMWKIKLKNQFVVQGK